MNSTILQTATRYLLPMLLVISVVVLFQGHNLPGGGFIAGLIGASGLALHGMAFGPKSTREALRINPATVMGVGLAAALGSGLFAVFMGLPLLTGIWFNLEVPGLKTIKVGTPVIFDIGVYLVVLGVVMAIVLSLLEE
ncbi:MAG: Na+/H+ antiporter subunit B [Phycisphaeraceae bacterium]|nr:Na+/H+ antiporter subunit B [Phycisphaeraceae bacterium]